MPLVVFGSDGTSVGFAGYSVVVGFSGLEVVGFSGYSVVVGFVGLSVGF